MNLPNVISNLLTAQNHFDSRAYADCFSEHSSVFDENEIFKGREEIKRWNGSTNAKYQTQLEPVEYFANDHLLHVKVSGTFKGSPIILKYQFEISDGQISRLRITS
ncbi:MAG TPA: nuclear transport factor 2 family protein [Puia sp.]|nr:nuclear transport factor 2 family protein [Puia sp.]